MKVSVITVNRNGNRYLKEAIDSVLMQHSIDLEYLIIDGGSTDGSIQTIAAAAANDKRIAWITEPDRGISDAMNKGIARATGEIVGFLHSDDRYADSAILGKIVGSFHSAPTIQWLSGGISMINSSGVVFSDFPSRRYSFKKLIRSNILFHPATFVRREALVRAGGFDTGLRLAMDYDLWLRLGESAAPLMMSDILAHFRIYQGSLSTDEPDKAMHEEFRVRKSFLESRGISLFPYYLHFMAKRVIYRMYVRLLHLASESRLMNCRR